MKALTRMLLCTLLGALSSMPTAQAVHENTAKTVGSASGTVIAILAAALVVPLCKSGGSKIIGILGSGVLGAWLGFCIRDAFQPYTPSGKFAFAQRQLAQVQQGTLLNNNFTTPDELMGRISARFGTNWSLVNAREELLREAQRLHGARLALTTAYEDARATPENYTAIMAQYEPLLNELEAARQKIEATIAFITSDARYHNQVELYQRAHQAHHQ